MKWARSLPLGEGRALPPRSIMPGTSHSSAGIVVNPETAMRLAAVWACVRLLSDTVSTLPVDVYRRDGDRQVKVPTPSLLVTPADGVPIHEWIANVVSSLLLRGNAYGVITARGTNGYPVQVELLSPDVVSVLVRPDDGRLEYRVGGQVVPRRDVLHVRAFTMPGSPVGLSPVEYAAASIGVGMAAEQFGSRFFADNATPSGVVTVKTGLTPEQADAIKSAWRNAHSGRRDVAVLTGEAEFRPITISPNDSQFVEVQRFTVAQVARVFGVPPEMIGAESGGSLTYANVEQRALDFVTFTLAPWITRLEVALSSLLPRGTFVKMNAGALLKADLRSRYEAHRIALEAGFLTVDEVRALEDRPPLPGGGLA